MSEYFDSVDSLIDCLVGEYQNRLMTDYPTLIEKAVAFVPADHPWEPDIIFGYAEELAKAEDVPVPAAMAACIVICENMRRTKKPDA